MFRHGLWLNCLLALWIVAPQAHAADRVRVGVGTEGHEVAHECLPYVVARVDLDVDTATHGVATRVPARPEGARGRGCPPSRASRRPCPGR